MNGQNHETRTGLECLCDECIKRLFRHAGAVVFSTELFGAVALEYSRRFPTAPAEQSVVSACKKADSETLAAFAKSPGGRGNPIIQAEAVNELLRRNLEYLRILEAGEALVPSPSSDSPSE